MAIGTARASRPLLWWPLSSGGHRPCAVATGDAQGNFQVKNSTAHGFGIDDSDPGRVQVAFSDIDNDRDTDLIIAAPQGVFLFSNQRDDTYADVSTESGLEQLRGANVSVPVSDQLSLSLELRRGRNGARGLLLFFYRFETCVREATVLGMLGVVSLGYWIQDARAKQYYDEVLVLVLFGAALVLAADLTSAVARYSIRRRS